ncbi:uncharacterized protein [Heterodontus francisci]|uniref:uncharacterized protein n=1 Tax=Heterodontus francisci TaxID=7792 RepID=UPI00355AE8E3
MLPFLDMLVEKTANGFSTTVYRKPTFTSPYTHWDLYSSPHYKIGHIRNVCKLASGPKAATLGPEKCLVYLKLPWKGKCQKCQKFEQQIKQTISHFYYAVVTQVAAATTGMERRSGKTVAQVSHSYLKVLLQDLRECSKVSSPKDERKRTTSSIKQHVAEKKAAGDAVAVASPLAPQQRWKVELHKLLPCHLEDWQQGTVAEAECIVTCSARRFPPPRSTIPGSARWKRTQAGKIAEAERERQPSRRVEEQKTVPSNIVQSGANKPTSVKDREESEAENDLYESPEEIKTSKVPQTQCKRCVVERNQTQKESQVRASLCSTDKPSLRKNIGKVSGLNKQRHNKRWKRSTKVGRKNADLNTATELKFSDNGQEFKEEPQWYTEPLSDNVISNNLKSKLETAYKSSLPSFDTDLLEKLPASIRDLCIDDNCPTDYLWTGAFVDGHFVDLPVLLDKGEFSEILDCSKTNSDSLDNLQKSVDLFCEGDINRSMVDSCAFDLKQDSGILNFIGSKNEDLTQFEGECRVILDGLPLNIWEDGPTTGGVETLSSPLGISCTNQLRSDQVKLWLSSTSGSSLIDKTGAQPFCEDPTPLSDKDDGWQDRSEASEKDTDFSVIKDQNDTVFSGETTNWENNSQGESVSLEPSQSSVLIATKGDDSVENKSSFSDVLREDCSSWSLLCKSGNLMPPLTLRNIDTVNFPIELNVNMATDIPTACSEDDLLSLLPGSEYLQLDDSFLIELPVMASKEKLEITKHGAQTDEIEAGNWNPIFGICRESLSEKKDDLNSKVIEEIWKATPDEDKTTFSEDGIKIAKCHSCSLGTELSMKQVAPAKLENSPLQKSENNFWEGKLGKSQILDSMDVDMTKHGSEWKTGCEQTDVSFTEGIEHLTLSNKEESEFSPSNDTLLKTTSPHSTSESSNFTDDPNSLIKAGLQQNVHVESIEEQSIINDISVDLPEDLWGNLTDYLNDSTEPRECSFLPFELSCHVPQMFTVTSSLDSNTGEMNQQPRTIPKLSSDLIIPHDDKLLSSVDQDCMTMSAQSNIYPTSRQLLTKEVVLTRLEDISGQKTECNFHSDHQGSSEMTSGSSNSTLGKEKSECHRVPKTNPKQDLRILQVEFESETCKKTDLDQCNLVSQDADDDKLSFLQSEFQELCPEHDHSKMPQQTEDSKARASNTRKKEADDQQQLEKGKANKNEDGLELCKVLLPKADSPKNCPKETCCLLLDNHLCSKKTDCLCCRNDRIMVTSIDVNPSPHEEQQMLTKPNETDVGPEDPRTDQKMCKSVKDCKT